MVGIFKNPCPMTGHYCRISPSTPMVWGVWKFCKNSEIQWYYVKNPRTSIPVHSTISIDYTTAISQLSPVITINMHIYWRVPATGIVLKEHLRGWNRPFWADFVTFWSFLTPDPPFVTGMVFLKKIFCFRNVIPLFSCVPRFQILLLQES